jgi:NADPH:quinone reductase-like Zn-dependent oxidoreductase
MRAVVIPRYGGPEVLEVRELPVPEPGPGEVRVRVAAATVNPTDLGLRDGRHAAADPDLRPPHIPGMELAGTVDAVGEGVTAWAPGDRVLGIVVPMRPEGGAQAEQVVVDARSLARVPAGASFAEAATLPMNGLTVRLALDTLALRPGQTLVVTGGPGAIGGYAIALARHEGLRVIADAGSPEDEALVRSFGAHVVVPRGAGFAAAVRDAAPEGADGVLDAALLHAAALPVLRDGAQVAAVRRFEGGAGRDPRVRQIWVSRYLHDAERLAALVDRVEDGTLRLRVAGELPAEHAAEAHRRLEAGGVRGRLVLRFGETG